MSNDLVDPRWAGFSFDALGAGRRTLIGASRVLLQQQSRFQQVVIADVPELGRGLFLDGNVQLLAEGEPSYHERIALLPALAHPDPARVLILGGGDGCAAREVLRDPRVREITLVELDPAVIAACAAHLAELNRGSLADPRVTIHTTDARRFLREMPLAEYDLAIVDFLDAYSAADLLLYDEVLVALAAGLGPEAIVSLHGDLANPPYWSALRLRAITGHHFPEVALHSAYIACYQSEWGFLLASRKVNLETLLTGEHLRRQELALAQPLQTVVAELFPAALLLSPALTAVAAKLEADPYAIPLGHKPETHWIDG